MDTTMRRFGAPVFRDRADAGRLLASEMKRLEGLTTPIVLALPRGGVPVGYEVAKALGAPLDVLIVRKLGYPGQEELAIGAVALGGVVILNEDLLETTGLPSGVIHRIAERERLELDRRERAYRGRAALPLLGGRSAILVDDGLATGATMAAAVGAARKHDPSEVIVGVPVAPADTVVKLEREADRVVCLIKPRPFRSIGAYYASFPQLSDTEVVELLARAASSAGRPNGRVERERRRGG